MLVLIVQYMMADSLVFGVFSYRDTPKMIQEYQPIADHLAHELNTTVILKILSQEELEKQVQLNKIDIVATNPTHFLALRAQGRLTGAIATEVKRYDTSLTPLLGGVIIVRSDRHDLRTLQDLKGHVIAIPGKKFLGGFQTENYEFDKEGINLNNDCKLYVVGNHDAVISDVLEGKADAGFVRTGIIEEMMMDKKIDPSKFFIVNEKHYNYFPMKISTDLYPEWAVAASANLPVTTVQKIVIALYKYAPQMHTRGMIEGFTIPSDYSVVDALARKLRLAPYEQAPSFTIADVWDKYKYIILLLTIGGIVILILLIIVYQINRKLNETYAQLLDLAIHDPLTSLFNRRGMLERLEFLLAELRRNKKMGAILYLDLDNFKPLNDTHGHVMGDELLIQVSRRIEANIRAIDTVARMGGDEFLVILSHLDERNALNNALAIAEKIRSSLAEPFYFYTEKNAKIQHSISASIGLIVFSAHNDIDTIINHADAAMYSAKAEGRNQIVLGESL